MDKHRILDAAIEEFRQSAHLMIEACARLESPHHDYSVSPDKPAYIDVVAQAQELFDIFYGQLKAITMTPLAVEGLEKRKMWNALKLKEALERYNLSALSLILEQTDAGRKNGEYHEAEARLRQLFSTARFPVCEDVYATSAKGQFYVTFAKLLTSEQIMFAESALNLKIERVYPLRNRYHVVVITPDEEEL